MAFRRYGVVLGGLIAAGLALGPAITSAGSGTSTNWPSFNGPPSGVRYSTLAQITPANAAKLHEVCAVKLADAKPSALAFQTGPVVVDGIMYATTLHDTFAIDATTCAIEWTNRHVSHHPESWTVNRGVAVAGPTLVRGQIDGDLTAIDRATGKTLWNVPAGDFHSGEALTAAPAVWHNLVFIAPAASELGIKGRIMAFDIATGRRVWTFSTIADGNDPNAKSWTTAATLHGGGGSWSTFAVDEKTGELFVPVGNPAPDFTPSSRPGANLYTNSIVVLDAATGKLEWYYQTVPADFHDWDVSAAPILYTAADGKSMVGLASKSGYIYGIDRSTHKLAFKTPGERIVNADVPITRAGTHYCPGALGGSEWNGAAFDAKDSLLIAPMDDWCSTVKLAPQKFTPGNWYMGGIPAMDPKTKAGGVLTAIDATSGKPAWRYHSTAPMLGGVTPTAGGVTLTGDMNGNFLVFDSKTGKVLLTKPTPSGAVAGGVVTYAVGGKQYVGVTSGNVSRIFWGVSGTPTIVVYAM